MAFELRSSFASRQVNQNLVAFTPFKCFSLRHLRVINSCTYYVLRSYPRVLITCVLINEGGDLIAEGLGTGAISNIWARNVFQSPSASSMSDVSRPANPATDKTSPSNCDSSSESSESSLLRFPDFPELFLLLWHSTQRGSGSPCCADGRDWVLTAL